MVPFLPENGNRCAWCKPLAVCVGPYGVENASIASADVPFLFVQSYHDNDWIDRSARQIVCGVGKVGDFALEHASDSDFTRELLMRVRDGDDQALEILLETQRNYLRRLVDLRMEDELRRRVDPSDIVQETLIVISRRVDDFLTRQPTSFRLWARRKAIERLTEARRKHLAGKRSVRRERNLSDASSMALARSFFGSLPGQSLERREMVNRVQRAIDELSAMDREVILLRHVEELRNHEIAVVLNLDADTASKRYGRAIRRLAIKMNEGEHR